MKITKRQLRRIIKEELAIEENPLLVTLQRQLLGRNINAEDLGNDELYIMTGEVEGITVKVLRRGR